jgi:hypothetical protein
MFNRSRDSSVVQRWATGWMIGGLESRQGLGIFLLTTASRPALGPTQHPIQWVPGALSLGVRRPRREADHSPPSRPRSRMTGAIPPLPQYASMAWCSVIKKHRYKFTFTMFGIIINFFVVCMTDHLPSSNTSSQARLRILNSERK